MQSIILGEKTVTYTLKASRRGRSMRITIHHDGSMVVSVPRLLGMNFLTNKIAEKFIIKKADWILKKLDHFKTIETSHGPKMTKAERKAEYIKNKERTQIFVQTKLVEFNKIYNFKYNNISIKNQKTRWGSCSKRGNLNFNYRIALIPEHLADYIVVHELCHLGELNHSKKFWNLVEKVIPEHKKLRKELHKIGINYQ